MQSYFSIRELKTFYHLLNLNSINDYTVLMMVLQKSIVVLILKEFKRYYLSNTQLLPLQHLTATESCNKDLLRSL